MMSRDGISLFRSSNNNITGNNISNNNRNGISLFRSNYNNIITGNNVSNNGKEGIFLWSSSNNLLFHNNLLNNSLMRMTITLQIMTGIIPFFLRETTGLITRDWMTVVVPESTPWLEMG